MNNKYSICLVDMSYILYRNIFSISAGKKPGEYNSGDVIRCTIQTLNKLPRDWGVSFDKCIMIYDRWHPDYQGYIRTNMLKGAYKDSRGDIEEAKGKADPLSTYMTKEKYEKMKADPDISQDDLEKAYEKLYFNEVKYDAKWNMVKGLKNFGVPCLGVAGYEFDDLAYIAAMMMYDENAKPSVIVTKDSDLQYCLTPKMDYFKLPTRGSEPEIITYNQMYSTIPAELRGKISLYKYKAILDSAGEGHNGMRKTRKDRVNLTEMVLHVLNDDYSDFEDPDLFKLQLSTFDVGKFPGIEEAKRTVRDLFPTAGKLGSLQEFHDFCDKYQVEGISDRYFTEFISRFDQKMYTER